MDWYSTNTVRFVSKNTERLCGCICDEYAHKQLSMVCVVSPFFNVYSDSVICARVARSEKHTCHFDKWLTVVAKIQSATRQATQKLRPI